MNALQLIEKIARHEAIKKDDLLRESLGLYLFDKKREYLREKAEILARYGVVSALQLKKAVKTGKVPEHPGWEDFIEVKNIDAEIKETENDLGRLRKA